MKKELALNFLILIFLFAIISLLRNFLNISYWPFLVGGIIGTLLPDVDHLIYVYFLRPQELTSQRFTHSVNSGNISQGIGLLSSTTDERRNMILHSVLFQIVFVLLAFLVVTSNSSLLGRGLVIAFLLHLLLDEYHDMKLDPTLTNWFKNIPIVLDKTQLNAYLIANFLVILLFGFVL